MRLIFVTLFAFLVILSCSCSSTKHINKEVSKVDSSGVRVRDSAELVINSLKEKFQQDLKEARQNKVVFEKVPCPIIPDIKGCDKDSLQKAFNQLNQYIKSLQNKVTISSDGAIQAEGRVKEAYFQLDKTDKQSNELSLSNQKLFAQHQKDSVDLVTAKTSTVKDVHRSSFSLWFLLIAFVGGATSWAYLGNKIKALIKVKSIV